MSYRFHPNKTITLIFTSGNTVTLGIDEYDNVLSLKRYISENKLDGVTAGYGRIVLSSLEDEMDDLYENTPNDVISVTIKDRVIGPGVDLRGENFEGVDLSGVDLSGANLSGANLSSANLSSTNLHRANLRCANLTSANLTSANLTEADLQGATLHGTNLTEANLTGVDFFMSKISDANFLSANLTSVNLEGKILTGINLTKANLTEANLTEANLTEANLTGANFTKANLSEANFTEANLSGANLTEAILTGVILTEAILTGVNLKGKILTGVDLTGADLTDADLTEANLIDADLSGATLQRANLTDAKLRDADLTEANLFRANLFSADLTNATLSSANLTEANLDWTDLLHSNLSSANLTRATILTATLVMANLTDADFTEANLTNADLTEANLSGADLEGAILTQADFKQANLSGANLSGAILENTILEDAILENTILERDADIDKIRLLFYAKKGNHARIEEILTQIPESNRKLILKKLALNEAIRHNKAGPTIDLLVEDRASIRIALRRFDLDSIDRRALLTQNPPRFPSTEEKCKKAHDMIMQDDVDIIKYLNVEDDDEKRDDYEKRAELEKRAVFFIGETPDQLTPVVMSLNQLLYNLHNSIYTSDCLKNDNGQYYSNAIGSRLKDAIFQFQTTSRYNVYLRNLIDVLSGDERVFYILPLMDENGRVVVERVASLGNVGVENPLGDIQPDYVSADHCQGDTERRMYGIYVCEGQGDNPLYPVCSD